MPHPSIYTPPTGTPSSATPKSNQLIQRRLTVSSSFTHYSEIAHHCRPSHLHGDDGLLPHNGPTAQPPPAQHAQVRPRGEEEGALPRGDQGWKAEINGFSFKNKKNLRQYKYPESLWGHKGSKQQATPGQVAVKTVLLAKMHDWL